jgi:RNA-directed DNA polymerase
VREEPVSESKLRVKSFVISKWVVWEAYKNVKANRGAAGVDEVSITEFEKDLKGNLYKLWNRMSSGSYFPPPVRAVEIPKKAGGVRTLGVPTVADRVAQTVVRSYLEPSVEPVFHADSYGYRPGRSAVDAVRVCRERCWKSDWVIDLDIRAFFDSIPHSLLLRAVSKHTDLRWVLLYVERWLKAPIQQVDGTLVARDRGTPQGSAISPLLANLFLHYAFDKWLAREYPSVSFERYADDAVVHCVSRAQAHHVLRALVGRMSRVGLELHPDKTCIVYCKDANRKGSSEHERFNFLGYTFRPRRSKGKRGMFVNFSPAVSDDAKKAIRQQIRSWRLHRRSEQTLVDLARDLNPVVQGWINYYGNFYKSQLYPALRSINEYLVRWAMRKYKRLRGHVRRAWKWLVRVAERDPRLFAHWRLGVLPTAG